MAVAVVDRRLVAAVDLMLGLRDHRREQRICRPSEMAQAIGAAVRLHQRTMRRRRDRLKKEKDPNEHSNNDQLYLFLSVQRNAYLAENCATSQHAFDFGVALQVMVVLSLYYGVV